MEQFRISAALEKQVFVLRPASIVNHDNGKTGFPQLLSQFQKERPRLICRNQCYIIFVHRITCAFLFWKLIVGIAGYHLLQQTPLLSKDAEKEDSDEIEADLLPR